MASGLDDIVAAETVLSDVDGLAGRLIVRGMPLETIAGSWRYEGVLHLMWQGFIDELPDRDALAAGLGEARVRVFAALAEADPDLGTFEAMRALMARIPDSDDLAGALEIVTLPAVAVPALVRLRKGAEPVAPDPTLSHAADIVRMLTGGSTRPAFADALDTYLVTVTDHGLNASTFAARIVASTQAGLTSSVLAALGALKGPLHGGAPGPVLDMLDAIGTPERAAAWIDAELKAGRRLMGFGHRIYRVRDPRADALSCALARLTGGERTAERADSARLTLARVVETEALAALRRHKPERSLQTNVEFYTALLLEALGFPRETFTAVFAIGRVGGWIAHAREQALTGRLMRPKSRYIGPAPVAAA